MVKVMEEVADSVLFSSGEGRDSRLGEMGLSMLNAI